MERSNVLLILCAWTASLVPGLMLQVQAQPGFISVDCGATNPYIDYQTGINFSTDIGFIDSGESMPVSTKFIDQQYHPWLKNLRSFPSGTRNCYTLKPDKGKNNTYLIRASFWYADYDDKNQPPIFHLYIDVNYWATVEYSDNNMYWEIVYVAQRDDIQVCLVNIGQGVPFISALELRTLNNSIYQIESGFLKLNFRVDVGGLSSTIRDNGLEIGLVASAFEISFDNWHMEHAMGDIALSSQEFCENVPPRHPDDVYDRIWESKTYPAWRMLNPGTSASDLSNNNDEYKVPGKVLRTAQTASDANNTLIYNLMPFTLVSKWIGHFHFAETQILPSGQQRKFMVSTSDGQFKKTVRLEYLKPVTVVSTPVSVSRISSSSVSQISFSFNATTSQSGNLPPIINALEIFQIQELLNVPTAQDDVKALTDIKAEYNMNKDSWQGDPCVPSKFAWDGVNCSYGDTPRVISLNMSSSNLRGIISSSLSNLLELESLDLSNNELTRAIPETLANLPKLKILNLRGNKLNGSIPEALKRRVKDKKLDLSFNDNPDLCWASPCPKNKSSILVPVVALVSGVVVVICLVTIWLIRRKQIRDVAAITTTATFGGYTGTLKLSKNRHFTSTEVARITDNFRTVIGEGGFGKVYSGRLDNGTQVAVKMLSRSSKQGYKEFHTEAQLLTVVHHRNLVSLIGYCEEFENMALIYEFMSNGNVRQHLSAHNPNVLSWSQRLQIAVDAAQGLEYLHNGYKPPIIHRDLKTPNILLNENMQAKICDFGLSKAFVREQDSYISTCPAGTPGYLDPEFHILGHSSQKSDIYSFGIVLFELITGHPAIIRSPESNMHILQWVTPLIERGDIQSIVDPRLNDQFNINSVRKVVEIAMACVPTNAVERADMNRVLSELKECLRVEVSSERSQRMGNGERRSEFDTTAMELDSPPYAR